MSDSSKSDLPEFGVLKEAAPCHYRRCHLCAAVSSSEQSISRCDSCGKTMAPFYYFDEAKADVYTDNLTRPYLEEGGRQPILGLTVHW